MQDNRCHTLSKKERLCSKTLIDNLFSDHSSHKRRWPIRVVYQIVGRKDVDEPQVEILVSVSKRSFKRAVKRNLVKRQIREAYRKNKEMVVAPLAQYVGAKLLLAFLWQDDKIHPSMQVEETVKELLQKVGTHIAEIAKEEGRWVDFDC